MRSILLLSLIAFSPILAFWSYDDSNSVTKRYSDTKWIKVAAKGVDYNRLALYLEAAVPTASAGPHCAYVVFGASGSPAAGTWKDADVLAVELPNAAAPSTFSSGLGVTSTTSVGGVATGADLSKTSYTLRPQLNNEDLVSDYKVPEGTAYKLFRVELIRRFTKKNTEDKTVVASLARDGDSTVNLFLSESACKMSADGTGAGADITADFEQVVHATNWRIGRIPGSWAVQLAFGFFCVLSSVILPLF